jgi:hypothetical protein
MKKILSGFVISAILISCGGDKKDGEMAMGKDTTMAAATETAKAPAGAELLEMSKADPVKKGMMAFSSKDIEGMTAEYADTVHYTWSSGDSLIGKQAVKDYYNGRLKLIDTLTYSDFILLPVKVNESQTPMAPTGDWVLAWAFAHVKYKNGKKLNFWVHQVNHYNSGGKIDFVGQYLDRAPINAATMGMKK